jgi:hypothetical protein
MTPDDIEATEIFDGLWDARCARVDAALQRIANTAVWLGKQLARHEITKADVNRRLDAMCCQKSIDDEDWVPWDLAHRAAVDGLRQGLGKTR